MTTITISAEQASGSLEISAIQFVRDTYDPPFAAPLTATLGGTEIGSIEVTRLDDESPPKATISMAPTTVNEGDSIGVKITLNPPFSTGATVSQRTVQFAVDDPSSTLSGTLPTSALFAWNQGSRTSTLTAADNTTQNDGAHDVTFALALNDDSPYTLGTPPAVTSVTITVRDDDTPPLAPGNLRAQAGNTEATLRWEAPPAPTPDHGQPILHYEYRVKEGTGSFGSWATIPNSDGTTTSHTFTGLTNDTEYTYEVRAENVAGDGAEAEVMVTPIIGVAVSFGAATLSVDEGGTGQQATVTLATAPDTGETVTVSITAAPGEGLGSSEYSGVPANVTFAAGEISKSFTVATVDDTDDEPDRLLTFSLGTLPAGYVPGTHETLALTVADNDVPIVSASFGAAADSVTEGTSAAVSVSLSQAPEREVVLPIRASRGANLAADEVDGVPAALPGPLPSECELAALPGPLPSECELAALAEVYDERADDALRPLPEIHADPVRRALDEAVVKAVPGLPGEDVARWRQSIALDASNCGPASTTKRATARRGVA